MHHQVEPFQLHLLVDVVTAAAALIPTFGRPALRAREVATGTLQVHAVTHIFVSPNVDPACRVVPGRVAAPAVHQKLSMDSCV